MANAYNLIGGILYLLKDTADTQRSVVINGIDQSISLGPGGSTAPDTTIKRTGVNQLDFGSAKLQSVADPVNNQDVATKKYVDDHSATGAAPPTDIQVWEGLVGSNVTDTWTKPVAPSGFAPYKMVRVEMIGGGGGGASQDASDHRELQGAGGQNGGLVYANFSYADLPSTVAITVGGASAGSAGRSNDAAASTFGTLLSTGAAAGGNNDGNNRTNGIVGPTYAGGKGGKGGASNANGSDGGNRFDLWLATGGTGGIKSTTGVGGAGGNGADAPAGSVLPGGRGGGGGGSTVDAGGPGGNGGKYGGGGGGAGGNPAATSNRSKGGDGGIGIIKVTTW